MLVDAGGGQVPTDLAAQPVRAQRSAGRREEEVVGEPVGHKAGADDPDIQAQPEERPLPDGDVAILAPFAAAHEHCPSLEVDVSQPK